MQRDLIFDCSFGAGANMLVGALLGLDEDPYATFCLLSSVLDQRLITNEGYHLIFDQRQTKGVQAYYFDCLPTSDPDGHTDDAGLAKKSHHQAHTSCPSSQHNHGARGPRDLHDLIDRVCTADATGISQSVIRRACERGHRIVDLLAQAEAAVHGIQPDAVHFHEIGAIDCYVDIMMFALCLEHLHCHQIYLRALSEGIGTCTCSHGTMSLPGLAVTKLLENSGLTLTTVAESGEHLTPTAAACLVGAEARMLPNNPVLTHCTSISCGSRTFSHPNICRLEHATISPSWGASISTDALCAVRELHILETNIDDSSGQTLAHCIDALLAAGARDAWLEPIVMKKGRPAHKLCALVNPEQTDEMIALMVTHTTSIGVRVVPCSRYELPRKTITVFINGQSYQAKMVEMMRTSASHARRIYPEHEEILRLKDNLSCGYEDARARMEQACQAYVLNESHRAEQDTYQD